MTSWFVRQSGGQEIGPVAAELLVRGIAAGKVPADADVREAGTEDWLPLEAVEEFQDALPEDGVQTRVIESPWFMEQTGRSAPAAATESYFEEDDAATRVAAAPSLDTHPSASRQPPPAAGASRRPPPPPPPRPPSHAPRPPPEGRSLPPRGFPPPPATSPYGDDDDAKTRVAHAPT
ncbi:MAG: DUF4339 domain-containing protein, partial [Sorangiineae bacterium]|nr:DUF4339 domain-containing protein [Sorangiineae bacterium]